MAPGVQFVLATELTSIVSPLASALSKLGSLAVIDAIKRSGSDIITETKLAALLGRHRIDPGIEIHFKQMVAKSDKTFLSRYVDIMLESGAGPTVQEALKKPALFSMVIQLSALAFAHEDESLANGVVMAIENILRDAGTVHVEAPDFVSLLGTIRACQEQTAAFEWSFLYESIERKIWKASMLRGFPTRSLPFAVLQSLMMWLQSLQSFPEDRILHLKCNTGISTIVVWCHHILGLNVTIRQNGITIKFGEGNSNIYVENSGESQVRVSLMDAVDQEEVLFSISSTDEDPVLESESRIEAYGYGTKVLEYMRVTDADMNKCLHYVVARAIKIIRRSAGFDRSEKKGLASFSGEVTENTILDAAKFLFATDQLDIETSLGDAKPRWRSHPRVSVYLHVAILFTFARIKELDRCKNMPLSIIDLSQLKEDFPELDRSNTKSHESMPNLLWSFRLLSRLLLGRTYSEEKVASAVLTSAQGWSIFLDSIDAADPLEISRDFMHIALGVPSRKGQRRTRIIDGPVDTLLPITTDTIIVPKLELRYHRSIGGARLRSTLVGHYGVDAFSVTQLFEWDHGSGRFTKRKSGLRQMVDVCVSSSFLPKCQCQHGIKDMRTWIDERLGMAKSSGFKYETQMSLAPEESSTSGRFFSRTSSAELVHSRLTDTREWFFFVGESPAARWLQLVDLNALCRNGEHPVVVRGNDCCLACAVGAELTEKVRETLVLL